MSFRFQKRIKLWKGFGLNISKSSITPSYRNKRGFLSSKGYSFRTGIPGLSYRKTFKKTKGSGCLITLMLVFLIPFFGILTSCKTENSNTSSEEERKSNHTIERNIPIKTNKWYQGGTLHKSKIIKWKTSTERNKLATCGDFCAKVYQNHSLKEIKILAKNLKTCIDEAVKGHNTSDNFNVSELASMCLILLEN